ncbi:coiled-coil domain-containing protein [Marinitoga litoralis]|uniref:coiled-coil domain-containing protein n=1 Tax=Marinitoga litoralis TaxID=570855 RepID=UPI00195F905F|nr:hypothetical protein [Marinitoga litoralis]MBM7559259.1 chromosome segregation ATPase [Marinitoga litoralis]
MNFELNELITGLKEKINIIDNYIESIEKNFSKTIKKLEEKEDAILKNIDQLNMAQKEIITENSKLKEKINNSNNDLISLSKKIKFINEKAEKISEDFYSFNKKYDLELSKIKYIKEKTEKSLSQLLNELENKKNEIERILENLNEIKNRYESEIDINKIVGEQFNLFFEELFKKIEKDLKDKIEETLDETYSLYEDYKDKIESIARRIDRDIKKVNDEITYLKLSVSRIDAALDNKIAKALKDLEKNIINHIDEKFETDKKSFINKMFRK